MSDERFDQDLRAVLAEDAPRDVPEDLRRRVAAVSATDPRASRLSSPAWRSPLRLSFGALVVALVVVAIGVWRLGQAPGLGVGATPSPAPTPSASPGAACLATEIDGQILGWQGAAGSRIADVEITNISDRSCVVGDVPTSRWSMRLVRSSSTPRRPNRTHTVGRDVRARARRSAPHRSRGVELLRARSLAADRHRVHPPRPLADASSPSPASGVSSDMAVPPCMGTTGGVISMNGWRR